MATVAPSRHQRPTPPAISASTVSSELADALDAVANLTAGHEKAQEHRRRAQRRYDKCHDVVNAVKKMKVALEYYGATKVDLLRRTDQAVADIRKLMEMIGPGRDRDVCQESIDRLAQLRSLLSRQSWSSVVRREAKDMAANTVSDLDLKVLSSLRRDRIAEEECVAGYDRQLAQAHGQLASLSVTDQLSRAPQVRQTVADLAAAASAEQSDTGLLFAGHRTKQTAAMLRELASSQEVSADRYTAAQVAAMADDLETVAQQMWEFAGLDQHDGHLTRTAVQLAEMAGLLHGDARVRHTLRGEKPDAFSAVLGPRGSGESALEASAGLGEDTDAERAAAILSALKLLGDNRAISWP